MNGHLAAYGRRNCNALCPAQLEHTLHILSKERSFNGKFIGQERGYEPLHPCKDFAKFHVHVLALAHVDNTHGNEACTVSVHANEGISHDVGSGVYTHYDLVVGNCPHINIPNTSTAPCSPVQSPCMSCRNCRDTTGPKYRHRCMAVARLLQNRAVSTPCPRSRTR